VMGHEVTVGASVGIALFDPAVDDARSLLVKADIAMYTAKLDPEHPWLVYQPGMVCPTDDEAHPHDPPVIGDAEPAAD
jgi:predicted signal transduction protein with EAL and GGDEF domain